MKTIDSIDGKSSNNGNVNHTDANRNIKDPAPLDGSDNGRINICFCRCLCFGKGEMDYSWGDPNAHHPLRCTAFISLLHTLHKCASYFTKASDAA